MLLLCCWIVILWSARKKSCCCESPKLERLLIWLLTHCSSRTNRVRETTLPIPQILKSGWFLWHVGEIMWDGMLSSYLSLLQHCSLSLLGSGLIFLKKSPMNLFIQFPILSHPFSSIHSVLYSTVLFCLKAFILFTIVYLPPSRLLKMKHVMDTFKKPCLKKYNSPAPTWLSTIFGTYHPFIPI